MDRRSFENRKPFAGERVTSMKRRCLDRDYRERGMYMVTLVVEGRRKLLGEVRGRSASPKGSLDAPHVELTPLGEAVGRCWESIPLFHPEITLVAMQMMPDHLHGILFVRQAMEKPLGDVIKGFKSGCNKAYRTSVGCVATMLQQTERQIGTHQPHTGHERGLLFERGYNDRLLLREGQLQRWKDYLEDNPRRLLAKREHPDLFRVHFGLTMGDRQYAAIGNRFLLERPQKVQVQCSRSLTDEQIASEVERCLAEARQGNVLVSPAISPGEKAVMRAALDEGLPRIFLSPNSITPLTKPGGPYIEACSRGNLLILGPWPQRSPSQPLSRAECLALNDMTQTIVSR